MPHPNRAPALVAILALAACRPGDAPDASTVDAMPDLANTRGDASATDATGATVPARDTGGGGVPDAPLGPLVVVDGTSTVRLTQSWAPPGGIRSPDAGCVGGMFDLAYHLDTGVFAWSSCHVGGGPLNYTLTPSIGSRMLTAEERASIESQILALRVVPARPSCATDMSDLKLHVTSPSGTVAYGMDIWASCGGSPPVVGAPIVSYSAADRLVRALLALET